MQIQKYPLKDKLSITAILKFSIYEFSLFARYSHERSCQFPMKLLLWNIPVTYFTSILSQSTQKLLLLSRIVIIFTSFHHSKYDSRLFPCMWYTRKYGMCRLFVPGLYVLPTGKGNHPTNPRAVKFRERCYANCNVSRLPVEWSSLRPTLSASVSENFTTVVNGE